MFVQNMILQCNNQVTKLINVLKYLNGGRGLSFASSNSARKILAYADVLDQFISISIKKSFEFRDSNPGQLPLMLPLARP